MFLLIQHWSYFIIPNLPFNEPPQILVATSKLLEAFANNTDNNIDSIINITIIKCITKNTIQMEKSTRQAIFLQVAL